MFNSNKILYIFVYTQKIGGHIKLNLIYNFLPLILNSRFSAMNDLTKSQRLKVKESEVRQTAPRKLGVGSFLKRNFGILGGPI